MQVPVKRTVVSMRDYARAVIKAWKTRRPMLPKKASVAVLWAQYMIETGGRDIWNWNVGNKKHVQGDGHDYHELVGTWECLAPAYAATLIQQGLAKPDTNESHLKACPKGKMCVIFMPPHPATRFVAYESLDEAMLDHLVFLEKRYGAAWFEVEEGNPDDFAHALKAGRDGIEGTSDDYFTASAEAYADGMRPNFKAFMNSTVFEAEYQATLAALDAPTQVPSGEESAPVSSSTTNTRMATVTDFDIVHPRIPMGLPGEDFPDSEPPDTEPSEG